jgi:AraC-like DNA-binding protein
MQHVVRNQNLPLLLAQAERLGISGTGVLKAVDLHPDIAFKPFGYIRTGQFMDAVEYVGRKGGGPDFGLNLGMAAPMTAIAAYAVAMKRSSTVFQALSAAGHFMHVMNSAAGFLLVPMSRDVRLEMHFACAGKFAPAQYAELYLVMTLRLIRLIIGPDWSPRKVGFAHRRTAEAEVYRRIFGCEAVFGAPADYIVISMADLERPFRFSSSPMQEILDAFLSTVVGANDSELQQRVAKTARLLMPKGRVSVATVADRLGISTRQLQRELAGDGLTFTRIIEEARVEIARDWIRDGRPGGKSLAGQLGLSGASAASRFMREHRDLPPAPKPTRSTRPRRER